MLQANHHHRVSFPSGEYSIFVVRTHTRVSGCGIPLLLGMVWGARFGGPGSLKVLVDTNSKVSRPCVCLQGFDAFNAQVGP